LDQIEARDQSEAYLWGAFLLFSVSAYTLAPEVRFGLFATNVSVGFVLASYTSNLFVLPCALWIFLLSGYVTKIFAGTTDPRWDYGVIGVLLAWTLLAGRYDSVTSLVPFLWAILLFRVPYETLRASLVYISLLCWL